MVSAELRQKALPWIVEQLRIRTDLDPNDMGEYVLTLLEYNGTREELYERTESEMREFLGPSAAPFVEALLDEIERLQNPAPQAPAPAAVPQFSQPQVQPQAPSAPSQAPAASFQAPSAAQNAPAMPFNAAGPMDFAKMGLPNPFELMQQMSQLQAQQQQQQRQGGYQRRPHGRSELSSVENELEYANRRLVVENVPREHLNEESLKNYFSQFGTLTRIKIDGASKLAEIEFSGHDEAKRAHKSPEPIFNNRFIKVFWRRNDPNDPQQVDLAAVKRMQDERQQQFKEKEAKRKEYQAKMQELIEKRAKLLQDQEALLQRSAQGDANTATELAEKQKLTSDLRTQLDDLRAEAAQLGIVGQAASTYRGRGGRGGPRGGFRGRGGAFRGRGGNFGAASLDMRPKSVLVRGVPEAQQEALMGELASSRYSGVHRKDEASVVIDFSDRRSAEQFYNRSKSLEIGPVDVAWVRGSGSSGDAEMSVE